MAFIQVTSGVEVLLEQIDLWMMPSRAGNVVPSGFLAPRESLAARVLDGIGSRRISTFA